MLKTINKQIRICDFCLAENLEIEAAGSLNPTGEDVCQKHLIAHTEEVRLPKEFGGEMSGYKVGVSPGFNAKMIIKYVEEKNA